MTALQHKAYRLIGQLSGSQLEEAISLLENLLSQQMSPEEAAAREAQDIKERMEAFEQLQALRNEMARQDSRDWREKVSSALSEKYEQDVAKYI